MTVPTLTSVSPASGHTGGQTLVEIVGTGFVVAATPAPGPDGKIPPAPPSLQVLFGDLASPDVRVLSATLARAVSPATPPTKDANGNGTRPTVVDVTVQNLDPAGDPIGGETATLAGAYTFILPDLTQLSDLARLVQTFILLLRNQVTPNVAWPVNTDFDDTTGDLLSLTKLPAFPGLVVADVTLRENAFYSLREEVEVVNQDGTVTLKAPPDTVDLVFSLVGLSDSSAELLNLAATTRRILRKNPRVSMVRDPAAPELGTVSYELAWEESTELKVVPGANQDNVRHFGLTVVLVGFDIEELQGLALGGPGDDGRAHEGTTEVTYPDETLNLSTSRIG